MKHYWNEMRVAAVMAVALFALVMLTLGGCASPGDSPTFIDLPTKKTFQKEVTVTSRLMSREEAHTLCYMKAREGSGAIITPNPTAPACSWREPGGRIMIVWTNPKSFNNHLGMESGGHELFHWHEVVDHQ